MLLRADEDNDDVIERFSLYYIFSVFPSFVYYNVRSPLLYLRHRFRLYETHITIYMYIYILYTAYCIVYTAYSIYCVLYTIQYIIYSTV